MVYNKTIVSIFLSLGWNYALKIGSDGEKIQWNKFSEILAFYLLIQHFINAWELLISHIDQTLVKIQTIIENAFQFFW